MSTRRLRQLIPTAIRRPLGKLRAVARRLLIWRQVAKSIKGASESDQAILNHAIRRSPLTVWHDLNHWQNPMVDSDCTVLSKGVGAFQVRAGTDDLFHVLPDHEPEVERVIRRSLQPGDVFVDAGSNIGYYTILAAQLVGAHGRVVAIEMMPETARILRNHIALNGARTVDVVEGALSEVDGVVVRATHPEGKFGQASIVRGDQCHEFTVRTTTLDSALRDVRHVRLMKMDLEGAELGALRGLGGALSKIDAIVFENQDAPEVVRWLEQNSFTVTRLDGNNALARRIAAG